MTAPRVKYEAPALHSDLRHIPTPAHLAPFVPRPRVSRAVLLIDTGYTPLLQEARPVRVVPVELPATVRPELVVDLAPEDETPRQRAQRLRREREKALREAVPTTRYAKGQRTKAINAATRARAVAGAKRRRSAPRRREETTR